MDQLKMILFSICFTLLIMKTASRVCVESDKAPSCVNSMGCVCQSPVCISKESPCPGQQNVTIIQPRFTEVPPYAFENYQSLTNLEITGGIVNAVNSKAFWGLSNLRGLSLRDNFLRGINNETLEGLNSLRHLDLSGNVIDDLEDSTFSGNKRIRILYLQRNLLNAIQRNMFAGCHMLQSLHLSSNSISFIDSGAFSDLQNLQELYLDENYLAIITPITFSGLTSLRYLNLNANFIQGFMPGALKPMKMLRSIDLSQNQIPFIIGNTFESLRNLEAIFLNENTIGRIDDGTFTKLTSLQTLQLSENRLVSWSFLSFPTPSNLKELFLAHNQISEVLFPTSSPEAQFPKLQYLDFSRNLLTTFPAFFLKDAPLLGHPEVADETIPAKFDLRENPLACDCDYSILYDSLAQLEIACIQNTTIQCSNGSLTVSDRMPPSWDVNDGVYCKVSGSPLPEVIWMNPDGQVVTGYYNVSGGVTWLPVEVMNADYMCKIYLEDDGEAGRQEIDPTDSSDSTDPTDSSACLLPSLMQIMIVITTLYITI